MGPTTYALCQKPVIGFVMWITTLCSFPPLFKDAPISLENAGSSVSVLFTAPVTKLYPLEISFEFPSAEALLNDNIVGSRNGEYCRDTFKYTDIPVSKRADLGQPIPFRVVIRNEPGKKVVVDRIFESLCIASRNVKKKNRTIGFLDLTEGNYSAEVISLESQRNLEGVKTTISLESGYGK